MLSYAVDDVRYLLPLADRLVADLRTKKREEWFLESCRSLQEDVAARDTAPKEDPWRVNGCGRLHSRGLALLKGMWDWREEVARHRDLPCFKIMSNKQMVAYAEQFEAGGAVTPPNGWRPRWKTEFADIVVTVSSSDASTWPQRPRKSKGRLTDAQRSDIDQLCKFRDEVAVRLEVESSLLASRATVEELVVHGNPDKLLMHWQSEALREGIQSLVNPETGPTA
jgi:ribonuclease D